MNLHILINADFITLAFHPKYARMMSLIAPGSGDGNFFTSSHCMCAKVIGAYGRKSSAEIASFWVSVFLLNPRPATRILLHRVNRP